MAAGRVGRTRYDGSRESRGRGPRRTYEVRRGSANHVAAGRVGRTTISARMTWLGLRARVKATWLGRCALDTPGLDSAQRVIGRGFSYPLPIPRRSASGATRRRVPSVRCRRLRRRARPGCPSSSCRSSPSGISSRLSIPKTRSSRLKASRSRRSTVAARRRRVSITPMRPDGSPGLLTDPSRSPREYRPLTREPSGGRARRRL